MLINRITPEDVLTMSRIHKLTDEENVCSSEAYTLYCGDEITEEMLGVKEFEEIGLTDNDPLDVLLVETNNGFINALYQRQDNGSILLYSLVKQDMDMELLDVVSML